MYTKNPSGLIGEYLFESPVGAVVRNTANLGTFDGDIVHDEDRFPLRPITDAPRGFHTATSLNYNVLRRLDTSGAAPEEGFAQYVQVDGFPDLTALTVEAWVKVDYLKAAAFRDPAPGAYPDGAIGFGACPQPVCKAFSWYLFLSTLQTDRNLILTVIPDGVTQGLPKQQDGAGGSGGLVSEDIVHAGQWTHIVATFGPSGANNIMHTYINGVDSYIEQVPAFTDPAGSPPRNIPRVTDQAITPSPGRPLRLGIFRDVRPDLDYQYSGRLCGVRIYDRALSAREVLDDYRFDICNEVVKPKSEIKEVKEVKELKEFKEFEKKIEIKELKEKDLKEKEVKEEKEFEKQPKEKSEKELVENPKSLVENPGIDLAAAINPALELKLNNLDDKVERLSLFIEKGLRPDLGASALNNEPDVSATGDLATGDPAAGSGEADGE